MQAPHVFIEKYEAAKAMTAEVQRKVLAEESRTMPFIERYSEKSFAVFGDTKPIKDSLKALGGRYNGNLELNGKKTPGWIFVNSAEEDVEVRAVRISFFSYS